MPLLRRIARAFRLAPHVEVLPEVRTDDDPACPDYYLRPGWAGDVWVDTRSEGSSKQAGAG